jgi:hypothetical protein
MSKKAIVLNPTNCPPINCSVKEKRGSKVTRNENGSEDEKSEPFFVGYLYFCPRLCYTFFHKV